MEYHDEDPNVESWLNFFLDGIIEVAEEAIDTVKQINILRDEDMAKIQSLGKTASESAMKVLPELYKLPIVNNHTIQSWTGFTKQGAQNVIDRFIDLNILQLKDENVKDSLKNEVLRRNPPNKSIKDPLPEPRPLLGSGLKNRRSRIFQWILNWDLSQ